MSNENVVQIKERSQTNVLIEELLLKRQPIWDVYCLVTGINKEKTLVSMEELVREFCQLTVDYISLSHFGVYQRILDGNERCKSALIIAEKIYPKISKATESILDFNDKYQELTPTLILNDLAKDLSDVGEHLASRIELEDELIGEMLA